MKEAYILDRQENPSRGGNTFSIKPIKVREQSVRLYRAMMFNHDYTVASPGNFF